MFHTLFPFFFASILTQIMLISRFMCDSLDDGRVNPWRLRVLCVSYASSQHARNDIDWGCAPNFSDFPCVSAARGACRKRSISNTVLAYTR